MRLVSYRTKSNITALHLDQKLQFSYSLLNFVFKKISPASLAIAWTGGKDSTLLLWLVREFCKNTNLPLPQIVFIDEGDVFEEVYDFTEQLARKWKFRFDVVHNSNVTRQIKKVGDSVTVAKLNDKNQEALKDLGFRKKSFIFEPESLIGNHLMKTVACNMWLEKNNIQGLCVGVRWDEQEERSSDFFIRKIVNPLHIRVEPILHFTEQEVWELTHKNNIPAVSLYAQGYRSLGAKTTTTKVSSQPAWEQNLIDTAERAGRHQDKEKIMKRLRDLGYM